VTGWTVTAVTLSLLLALAALGVLRGGTLERVVALQLAGVLAPLLAVVVAITSGRGLYLEVALALAVVSLGGALAYARFLERWL
jgi:multicomponent Na+:H+ antiporter subunit F